jgi:hypothetical protein
MGAMEEMVEAMGVMLEISTLPKTRSSISPGRHFELARGPRDLDSQ